MTDEKDIAQPPTAQRDMPVHCVKCDVFNERAASVCISCGAHLRLKCKKCGAANLRTASRCNRCHQRMRAPSFVLPRWNRPFSNLMKKTSNRAKTRKRSLRALGLLALVGLVIWMVYQRQPEPYRPPANPAVSPE